MKPDYEKQLKEAIQNKLRELPELPAPDYLASRVIATLKTRHALPWYQRPWQTWSPAGKTVSLLLFLASFGGLCFAGQRVFEANTIAKFVPPMGDWLSMLSLIWNTLNVLSNAALLAIRQLSPIVLLSGVIVASFAYALCIGLGTFLFHQARKINYYEN